MLLLLFKNQFRMLPARTIASSEVTAMTGFAPPNKVCVQYIHLEQHPQDDGPSNADGNHAGEDAEPEHVARSNCRASPRTSVIKSFHDNATFRIVSRLLWTICLGLIIPPPVLSFLTFRSLVVPVHYFDHLQTFCKWGSDHLAIAH
mmetsp:Transcript_21876/g.62347  ORF Transcript_21876/g.62347 Transcript_21876/m.62347 type:complete len:146 (+) Transcript_21876:154-591(+)